MQASLLVMVFARNIFKMYFKHLLPETETFSDYCFLPRVTAAGHILSMLEHEQTLCKLHE